MIADIDTIPYMPKGMIYYISYTENHCLSDAQGNTNPLM